MDKRSGLTVYVSRDKTKDYLQGEALSLQTEGERELWV